MPVGALELEADGADTGAGADAGVVAEDELESARDARFVRAGDGVGLFLAAKAAICA